MIRKTCSHCLIEKDVDFFNRDKSRKDGFFSWCKDCSSEHDKNRYYNTGRKEYCKERRKILMLSPVEREKLKLGYKRYRESARGRQKKYKNELNYIKNNPEKHRARYFVRNAIRDGRLVRMPCEKCGNEKSHAHHNDYSKPLDIEWLCETHHNIKHGKMKYAIR